jgi:hypothetical protein
MKLKASKTKKAAEAFDKNCCFRYHKDLLKIKGDNR